MKKMPLLNLSVSPENNEVKRLYGIIQRGKGWDAGRRQDETHSAKPGRDRNMKSETKYFRTWIVKHRKKSFITFSSR